MQYKTIDDEPTEYLKTRAFIGIWDGKQGVTQIERTGICCPGPWPSRAVYKYKDGYYILEEGYLIPSDEWHNAQKAALGAIREPDVCRVGDKGK